MDVHAHNKQALEQFRAVLYDYDAGELAAVVKNLFEDATLQLAYPFETLKDHQALLKIYAELQIAWPDLERRDMIVMAGSPDNKSQWVGCCGYYTGRFKNPWLDILPTGHQTSMRFHEFFRFENGKIIEMQALWDIPEVMMQANSWPMVPSLGREWLVPGPATQDGLTISSDLSKAKKSQALVLDMLIGLGKYKEHGLTGMALEKYWHPKFSWYGPSGIGTSRGISGFRNWHQIPFLNAMPDRLGDAEKGNLFSEGDYVSFTAWPGMSATISNGGWMGIAPSNQKITMRSLDFWRCENGLIRENWVLVDILDVYNQIGVDVFARMREFNKARIS